MDLSDHLMVVRMTVDLGPHSVQEWIVSCTGCDWHCHLRSTDRVSNRAAFDSHLKLIEHQHEAWQSLVASVTEYAESPSFGHAALMRSLLEALQPAEPASRIRFMEGLKEYAESVEGYHYWLTKDLGALGVSVRSREPRRPPTIDDWHWLAGTGPYAQ